MSSRAAACGIYSIRNKASGKIYIGSSRDIIGRLKWHCGALRLGKHFNKRLAAAYVKAGGWDVFETDILEECSKEDLGIREQYWVDTLKPQYNICVVDIRLPREVLYTPESAAKIRASWTPERRDEARLLGLGIGSERLAAGRVVRWNTPGAREAQAAAMASARAKTARTTNDIRALVAVANPFWDLVSTTGTGTKAKVTIHCRKHVAEHTVVINSLVSRNQGCKACGYERAAAKQKGIVKPSMVARWDRVGRKTPQQLKAEKQAYDRQRREALGDTIRAYDRQRSVAKRDEKAEYDRQYRERNREERLAKKRAAYWAAKDRQ